jgi:ribosome biogenesis protein Nip4
MTLAQAQATGVDTGSTVEGTPTEGAVVVVIIQEEGLGWGVKMHWCDGEQRSESRDLVEVEDD